MNQKFWESISDVHVAKEAAYSGYERKGFEPDIITYELAKEYDRILDFGCGIGRNLSGLCSGKAKFVVGHDFPNVLSLAHSEGFAKEAILISDWNEVAKIKFDCIFSSLCLQHIPVDLLRSRLKDFGRMCKKLVVVGRTVIDDDLQTPIWPIILERFFTKDPFVFQGGIEEHLTMIAEPKQRKILD